MWIWDKLTKAEVVRTEKELKINSFSNFPLWFNLLILAPIYLYYIFNYITSEMVVPSLIMYVVFGILSNVYLNFNTGKITFNEHEINGILEQGKHSNRFQQKFPFFIDIKVESKRDNIKIKLYEKNTFLGKFMLKNGNDLTNIIDNFIDLLDLELIENRKLSKGEILSFKSKNSTLPIYSDIQIKTIPNQMILISKTNSGKWTEFLFHENKIKNYKKSIEFTNVNKLSIKPNKANIKLEALLNNNKKVELFRHSSTEITVIRDSKLLKETLENRQELQGIEIELIEK